MTITSQFGILSQFPTIHGIEDIMDYFIIFWGVIGRYSRVDSEELQSISVTISLTLPVIIIDPERHMDDMNSVTKDSKAFPELFDNIYFWIWFFYYEDKLKRVFVVDWNGYSTISARFDH